VQSLWLFAELEAILRQAATAAGVGVPCTSAAVGAGQARQKGMITPIRGGFAERLDQDHILRVMAYIETFGQAE
jgi:hypothetical protein